MMTSWAILILLTQMVPRRTLEPVRWLDTLTQLFHFSYTIGQANPKLDFSGSCPTMNVRPDLTYGRC